MLVRTEVVRARIILCHQDPTIGVKSGMCTDDATVDVI